MPKKASTLLSLSKREKQIISATIYLWKINLANDFVPDYHLLKHPELSSDIMRAIRNIVQEVEKNNA